MIQVFLTIFIAVLIGIALVGPIADQSYTASLNTNTSSFGPTVIKLVPGLYVIMILGVVVAGLYSVFGRMG